ncbi:MAG: hypothetical protein ACFFCO_04610 [Promethearchaeota archaeon]
MPRSKRDEKEDTQEEGLGWKIERRQQNKWVMVCPQCFSMLLQPLPTASGILEAARYRCRECGYSGIAIEVNREDLEDLHRRRRAQKVATDSN